MNYPKIRAQEDMRKAFAWLFVTWIVYVALTMLAPEAEAVSRYGLTLAQASLLRVAIVVPLFLIWITSLIGFVWFKRYSLLVKNSPEEDGFYKITLGLLMLLLVVIVPNVINSIFAFYPHSQPALIFNIIFRNYITLVLYGIGFWYVYQASRSLLQTINAPSWGNHYRPIVLGGVALLTFVYIWLVFQNPYRSISMEPSVLPTYGLHDWLIVGTVVLPYVFIWMVGCMAILNFWSYAKTVPGVIYRKTFNSLAQGLTVTIVLIIFLQFLSQANAALNHAALKIILIIIYLLLVAIAIGYALIARGARKLAEIEEVG